MDKLNTVNLGTQRIDDEMTWKDIKYIKTDIMLPYTNVSLWKVVPKATFVMYMTLFLQRKRKKHIRKQGIVNVDDLELIIRMENSLWKSW